LTVRVGEAAFYLLLLEAAHNFMDFTFHEWCHRLPLLAVVLFALRVGKRGESAPVSLTLSRPATLGGAGILSFLILGVLGVGAGRDYLARMGDLKASALFSRGDLEGAQAAARKSLELRENNNVPLNVLGALEDFKAKRSVDKGEKEKHFLAARENFKKAIELSPYSLTPRENEIQSLINCGKLEEALELQKDLVDRAPELPTSYIRLGWIFFHMGRPKEAIKPAQKAIDLDGYFVPGYMLKAQALEAMGKTGEALKTYLTVKEMLQSVNGFDSSGQVEAGISRLQNRK
jgi:tetratricopeptide (TPR) repeat protein